MKRILLTLAILGTLTVGGNQAMAGNGPYRRPVRGHHHHGGAHYRAAAHHDAHHYRSPRGHRGQVHAHLHREALLHRAEHFRAYNPYGCAPYYDYGYSGVAVSTPNFSFWLGH
jgi:hypothetical protein